MLDPTLPLVSTVTTPSDFASPAAEDATSGLPAPKIASAEANPYLSTILPLSVFAGLLVLLAMPMLRWWYWEYTKPDSYYGYAFFVPPSLG
jgi:hypothetical protein